MKIDSQLNIIICSYNMKAEIENTLLSCIPPFQKSVEISEYSIVVVDNGSTDGTSDIDFKDLAPNITYVKYPNPSPSPAPAMNWAVQNFVDSEYLMLCIDGARMFSQNLISKALEVQKLIVDAFVYSIGYHIGPRLHQELSAQGWTAEQGQSFLNALKWQDVSGALKQNSVLAMSSENGYFSPISESNAFCISRKTFDRIGGFDERFTSPGGGLCNLELFQRYVQDQDTINVCLLNEGNFHQYHEGISTSRRIKHQVYGDEYQAIFGMPFVVQDYPRFYY